jgi:hypothetical protein
MSRASIACALLVVLSSAPCAAQTSDASQAGDASLWLRGGASGPEGRLNPREHVSEFDTDLLAVGIGLLAGGYVESIVYAGVFAGEQRSIPMPCRDTSVGLAFIPVLGGWLSLAASDQCSYDARIVHRNELGQIAWSYRGPSVDSGVDGVDAAAFVIGGLAQGVGLVMLIAGLLGHHTEIVFDATHHAAIDVGGSEHAVRVGMRGTF